MDGHQFPAHSRLKDGFLSSTCPHDCPSTCAVEVEVTPEGRVGKFRGAADHSYTVGVLCAKVSRYAERVNHPDRLLRPLRRTGPKGSRQFTEISWQEALDRTAEAFQAAADRFGSEAVWPYYYAGTMGHIQRDSINRLRHALRYSGQKRTVCTGLARAGWLAGTGAETGTDLRTMTESDLIIVWGGNPVATGVHTMAHIAAAQKARGAKLVVVDPYRTPTAEKADLHIALAPGTDGALAAAIMHCAFRDGLADRAYLRQFTDFPADLETHLAAYTPDAVAAITGVPVAQIEQLASLYNRTDRAYIYLGFGFSRSRNGAANVHAVSCLPAIGGKWRNPGGGAFWNYGGAIYGLKKTLVDGADIADPTIREMDMSRIGITLTGHLTGDRSELGDGPPVMAMLIQNTNPMVIAPNSSLVRRGFAREDLFVCVHEQFMTDTAAMADIVLPATMFVEHDDLYTAGAHSTLMLGPKLVDAPGECRENVAVIDALADRLGAQHPGFGLGAAALIDGVLRDSGLGDLDSLRRTRWIDCTPPVAEGQFQTGFKTPDGKFHFSPDWSRIGPDHAVMPRLPGHWDVIEDRDATHPFRLIVPPARQFLNSSFNNQETGRKREGRPTVMIAADAAEAAGIADGALVTLGNQRGQIQVHARRVAGQLPHLLVIEGLWSNGDFVGGQGANTLTTDFRAPPNGGAAFHDCAVWLRPAEPAA